MISQIKSGDKFPDVIEFYVTTENLEIIDLTSLFKDDDD